MALTRRALVAGGVVVTLFAGMRHGVPALSDLFADDFVFEPLDVPTGYRRIAHRVFTSRGNALVGLDTEGPLAMLNPEGLLHSKGLEDQVPVAVFSDYNCPNCRAHSETLIARSVESDVAMRWHELPLLAPSSMTAARAAIAADRQGAYVAMHRRLMGSGFRIDMNYIRHVAEDLGLDPARLLSDMQRPEVDQRIATSKALAALFGFIGTPAMVVGRTAVLGAMDRLTLDRLITRERRDGPMKGLA